MLDQWRLLCNLLWPEPDLQPQTFLDSQPGLFKNTHFALLYSDSVVKSHIRNNKFHFHKKSAKQLAQVVDRFIKRYPTAIVVPIPSSPNREQNRGYQHLLHILQYSQYRNQVRTGLLRKKRNTPQQSHVSRAIRLRQQHGSFACQQEKLQQINCPIILFDDVVTTESTMAAARAQLAAHTNPGTKIICFALAH